MNISNKHDLAIRFLCSINQSCLSIEKISLQEKVSVSYLEQLASALRKSGLIVSVRGPGGGYQLSAPLTEIRVVDVLQGVGMSQDGPEQSPLFTAILSLLGNTTIADVAAQRAALRGI